MKTFIEIFGWYGTIAILLAYILVSFSVIPSDGLWYQLLNATGALGLVFVCFQKKAYQPGALNIVWILVAIVALAKNLF